MTWVLIGVGAWVALAVVAALVIGRSIGLADRQTVGTRRNFIADDVPAYMPLPRTSSPAERLLSAEAASTESVKDGDAHEDPSTVPGIPSARPNVLPPVPPSSIRPKDVRRQSEAG